MANQGIYHPTFNPNGSKLANDNKKWYETTVSLSSISDCFDASKALTASGYIGTTSARPDGLFYDQIHEGDIIDLRMNSAKVEDYNRLIDREFNKLVAGTYRGTSKEPRVTTLTQLRDTTTAAAYITIPTGYTVVEGSGVYHNGVAARVMYQSGQNVYTNPSINIVLNSAVMCSVEV